MPRIVLFFAVLQHCLSIAVRYPTREGHVANQITTHIMCPGQRSNERLIVLLK